MAASRPMSAVEQTVAETQQRTSERSGEAARLRQKPKAVRRTLRLAAGLHLDNISLLLRPIQAPLPDPSVSVTQPEAGAISAGMFRLRFIVSANSASAGSGRR